MSKTELYVSLDIETDGPCPGLNSMLAIGAAMYLNGKEIETFYSTIEPLPDGMQNNDTMIWWNTQPAAWLEVNRNQRAPHEVMGEFGLLLDQMQSTCNAKLIPAAWPAAFDFGHVNYYLHQFYGINPLGFACLDIRSYANGLFNTPGYYEKISEGDLYKKYNVDRSGLRPHVAVDDAIGQGRLLMALIHEAESRRK